MRTLEPINIRSRRNLNLNYPLIRNLLGNGQRIGIGPAIVRILSPPKVYSKNKLSDLQGSESQLKRMLELTEIDYTTLTGAINTTPAQTLRLSSRIRMTTAKSR